VVAADVEVQAVVEAAAVAVVMAEAAVAVAAAVADDDTKNNPASSCSNLSRSIFTTPWKRRAETVTKRFKVLSSYD